MRNIYWDRGFVETRLCLFRLSESGLRSTGGLAVSSSEPNRESYNLKGLQKV